MLTAPTPAVLTAARDGRILVANATAVEMFGEAVGRRCTEVVGGLIEAQGIPCDAVCARKLFERGVDQPNHVRFQWHKRWFRLVCIPTDDVAVCVATPEAIDEPEPNERLTDRERQVLTLVAAGWKTDDIAEGLGVQPGTVRTHVEKMRLRFAVATRAALVARCLRLGLIG